MTSLLFRRLAVLALLPLIGIVAGATPGLAGEIQCTASSRAGMWDYSYGSEAGHLDLVEVDQKALAFALKSAEAFDDPKRSYGSVQLRLIGDTRQLLVKLPAVVYLGHSSNFEKLVKDWKGFTLVLSVDGKEVDRSPFKYDSNTVMSYEPADKIVNTLKPGGEALFTLLDNGASKEVVAMTVPLKGFAEAIEANRAGKAVLSAKVAAGATCRESSILDWE